MKLYQSMTLEALTSKGLMNWEFRQNNMEARFLYPPLPAAAVAAAVQGQPLSAAAACLLYDSDSLWSSGKLQSTAALSASAAL